MNFRIAGLLIAACTILLSFGSCTTLLLGPEPDDSPQGVFEYMAQIVENRYALFGSHSSVNWDSVRAEYKPRLFDSMSNERLFEVVAAALNALQDGHVNVSSAWDISRNWDWYLDYPANFNYNIIERNYLGKDYRRTGPFYVKMLPDSIAYVYYRSFSPTISSKYLNALMEHIAPAKALIFDIRMNGGGKLYNTRKLAARFADTTRVALQFYYKGGPERDEFDGPFDFVVQPAGKYQFNKPVVLLVNRKSYSAATFFPAIMSAYPHVTLMGDTTGGGGGIPYFFELPNGWQYRFSVSRTIDSNGRNIEFGIPPDVKVALSTKDEAKGADTIIETARAYLRKKTNKQSEK